MLRGSFKLAGLAVLASVAPMAASAATSTATMAISATVLKACIVAALPMTFGNYDPTATAATSATATTTVTCTTGTSFQVGLDAGTTPGETTTARAMAFLTNTLGYGLYQDAAHSINWGSTPATEPTATIASIVPSVLTVYGLVPAQQNVVAGAYTDLVTVVVTY